MEDSTQSDTLEVDEYGEPIRMQNSRNMDDQENKDYDTFVDLNEEAVTGAECGETDTDKRRLEDDIEEDNLSQSESEISRFPSDSDDDSNVSHPSKRQRILDTDNHEYFQNGAGSPQPSSSQSSGVSFRSRFRIHSNTSVTDNYASPSHSGLSAEENNADVSHRESLSENVHHAVAETLRTSASEKSAFGFRSRQSSDFSVVVFDISNDDVGQSDEDKPDSEVLSSKDSLRRRLSSLRPVIESENVRTVLNMDTLEDTSSMATCDRTTPIGNINDLPTHILIAIFKNLSMKTLLSTMSLVCKAWYHLARDPSLWHHIDLQHQHKADDNILWVLTSLSDRVVTLNLCDTKLISADCLLLVAEKCPSLQTIVLTRFFGVTDDVLNCISIHCQQLLNLHLEGCYKISDEGLLKVAEGCRRLRQVHLSRCSYITDKGVSALATRCRFLQQITLENCRKVTNNSVLALADGCPNMEFISLMFTAVTDESVKYIRKMRKLTVLDLSSNPSVNPRSLASITQFCSKLECINVSLNEQLDDDCIVEIVRCGRELKRLYCVSCAITDRALIKIGEYTKTLVTLDIGWCKEVTDEGVCKLSATCPTLRYLGLIRCDKVTADTVEHLVSQYPLINYSTFLLESRKLIEKARQGGFQFNDEINVHI